MCRISSSSFVSRWHDHVIHEGRIADSRVHQVDIDLQREAGVSVAEHPICASPVRLNQRRRCDVSGHRRQMSRDITNGEGGNRTHDTTIFSRVLYQLSYLALNRKPHGRADWQPMAGESNELPRDLRSSAPRRTQIEGDGLEPGNVEKTNATRACATLEV